MPPAPLVLTSLTAQQPTVKSLGVESTLSPAICVPKLPSNGRAPHGKSTATNSIPRRPRPFAYSISTVLELPYRLSHPPSPPRSNAPKHWSVSPNLEVSLEDILDMRHLSPLSLKDFEQYLLFEEYGAENLYFILWLRDYTSRYNAGASSVQLSLSISRAKATFFSSESQYELNLAASRVGEFLAAASGSSTSTPASPVDPSGGQPPCDAALSASTPVSPHPSAFSAVSADVEHMLRISAGRFVRARIRNANSRRAACVVFGVIATFAIALTPLLLSVVDHKGRWVRFGMFPPLWIGFTMIICALNGLCFILYLMGGSRQLHPFELHRPAISPPIPYTPRSPYEHSLATSETLHDALSIPPAAYSPSPSTVSFQPPGLSVSGPLETQGEPAAQNQKSKPYLLPEIQLVDPIGNIFEFETAGFIPADDLDTASFYTRTDVESSADRSSTHVDHFPGVGSAPRSPKFEFDFDSLPVKTLNSTTGPSALQAARGHGLKGLLTSVFSPLTHIESPVISRAQWEIMMRSSFIAVFLALISTGFMVALPF